MQFNIIQHLFEFVNSKIKKYSKFSSFCAYFFKKLEKPPPSMYKLRRREHTIRL